MVELMSAFEEQYPLLYLDFQEKLVDAAVHDPTGTIARLMKARDRTFAAFRKVVSDGIGEGTFKPILPPGLAAEAAIGMICWSYRWFDPEQSRFSGAEIGAAFADLLLTGMIAGRRDTRSRAKGHTSREGKPS